MKKLITIAGLVAAGLAVPAFAQAGPPPEMQGAVPITRVQEQAGAEARFDTLDADHDGTLSAEEMAAGRPAGGPGGRMRGPGGPGGGMGGMGRADTDGDGKVGKAEFVAAQLRRFDMMDENKDGTLTGEEREAARAHMMMRMQGGGAPSGGDPSGGGWGSPPSGDE